MLLCFDLFCFTLAYILVIMAAVIVEYVTYGMFVVSAHGGSPRDVPQGGGDQHTEGML